MKIVVPNWKPPSVHLQENGKANGYINSMEHYSDGKNKRNKPVLHITTWMWMYLKDTVLSERRKTQGSILYNSIYMKFKNRQDETVVLSEHIRWWVEEQIQRPQGEHSVVVEIFHILIWLMVMQLNYLSTFY